MTVEEKGTGLDRVVIENGHVNTGATIAGEQLERLTAVRKHHAYLILTTHIREPGMRSGSIQTKCFRSVHFQ